MPSITTSELLSQSCAAQHYEAPEVELLSKTTGYVKVGRAGAPTLEGLLGQI